MATKTGQRILSLFLLIGDVGVLYIALWATLLVRYLEIPSAALYAKHVVPFTTIFVIWVLVFYISDLYGRAFRLQSNRLLDLLFKAQAVNSIIAALFFYLLPYYGITPKTVLAVFVVVAFLFLAGWRMMVRSFLGAGNRDRVILIGERKEFEELCGELEHNVRHGFEIAAKFFVEDITKDFEHGGRARIQELLHKEKNPILIVESFRDLPVSAVTYFYELMGQGISFFDFQKFYEIIFQYVPLSFVDSAWLLENVSSSKKEFYDIPKRVLDILAALFFGVLSLAFYPFIALLIKFSDGGPVFFVNERIGQGGAVFRQIKFRTMSVDADARWPEKNDQRIIRGGKFLRATRLDELPQLWNVLRGDMSFVGPRPDFAAFAKTLEEHIPYYTIRNLIKPGLTGWAQIQQQKPPASVEETEQRLAYDIYYLKNRSLWLDLTVILQTIRIMVSRRGV